MAAPRGAQAQREQGIEPAPPEHRRVRRDDAGEVAALGDSICRRTLLRVDRVGLVQAARIAAAVQLGGRAIFARGALDDPPCDEEELRSCPIRVISPRYLWHVRASKYSREVLLPIVREARSLSEVMRKLGLRPTGGMHRLIAARVRAAQLDTSHFTRSRTLANRVRAIDVDALRTAVASSISVAQVLTTFELPSEGRAHREMTERIRQLGIACDHLKGSGWARGETRATNTAIERNRRRRTRPDVEIFVERSPETSGPRLVKRLLARGWTYRCRECGLSEWRGSRLVLHLDHINGVHDDNRLENLRLLCPNCHSLTETYCNRRRPTEAR